MKTLIWIGERAFRIALILLAICAIMAVFVDTSGAQYCDYRDSYVYRNLDCCSSCPPPMITASYYCSVRPESCFCTGKRGHDGFIRVGSWDDFMKFIKEAEERRRPVR